MYRARDQVEQAEWIELVESAATSLELPDDATSMAADLYLADVPEEDRSKPTAVAASLYAAGLISGNERSQQQVADTVDVSRLSVQQHWRDRLELAGFEPPAWG